MHPDAPTLSTPTAARTRHRTRTLAGGRRSNLASAMAVLLRLRVVRSGDEVGAIRVYGNDSGREVGATPSTYVE
jgi:hypothetical protein